MSDSVWPHRWQPTRLLRPWDSPGKNPGVDCHFLLQCMKVKSESEVAQLCQTLSDPMDRSLPGSRIHGSFQARVLEWGSIAFSFDNFSSPISMLSMEAPFIGCCTEWFHKYMKFWQKQNWGDRKQISVCPRRLVGQWACLQEARENIEMKAFCVIRIVVVVS